MRRVLFLFLDHFSSTYLLLFCFFCSIYINAHNVEIKERDDSIPTISKGLVTIKENTTVIFPLLRTLKSRVFI